MSGTPQPRDFGDYRLLHPLGRGGMGTVHAAVQRSLQRMVAIKLLLPGAVDERSLWRFRREAKLLAQLDHPGIVKAIDAGVVDGRPYLAMELVAGASLADVLGELRGSADAGRSDRDGAAIARVVAERAATTEVEPGEARPWSLPLDPVMVMVAIVAEVGTALASAHAAGVVHRDVKPGNILIRRDGSVRIADFGIAHRDDVPALTATGDRAGTPSYMAPEQLRGEPVDHRVDVFALGVVLYEALTLRLPFAGQTLAERLACLGQAPTPARRLIPGLGRDLSVILDVALAPAAADRYASVGDFAADLRAVLAGRPVQVRPPGLLEELWRGARRRPWLVAAVMLLLLAVSVLFVIDRRGRNEVRAESERATAALAEVQRLAIGVRLDAAIVAAKAFRVARVEDVPAMRRWQVEHGEPLSRELPRLQAMLAQLRTEALPYGEAEHAADVATHPAAQTLARIEDELAFLDEVLTREPGQERALARRPLVAAAADQHRRLLDAVRTWHMASVERQFLHDQVAALVQRLEAFATAPDAAVRRVAEQVEWAEASHRRTVVEAMPAWERLASDIAADPRFTGLRLAPQRDLLPIGKDPHSGLWEFVHLRSGAMGKEAPVRGDDGRLLLTADTGIVFVLLPGGSATIGAQRDDPQAAHYDPAANPDEGPVSTSSLPPFFCAKYEVTMEQWARLARAEDSATNASDRYSRRRETTVPMAPMDSISQNRAILCLGDHGLELPSEAQWEYACRGGSTTPFPFGPRSRAVEHANFADRQAAGRGVPTPDADLDDGFAYVAPVGRFQANAFGLHDMLGNVGELISGRLNGRLTTTVPGLNLRQQRYDDRGCLARGGSYRSPLAMLRAAARRGLMVPEQAQVDTGLRVVRAVER